MAETFTLSELVIPGTYVRVSAEGLITAGGISAGNVGIVGTAASGAGETHVFSDFATLRGEVGEYDAFSAGQRNLTRGAELAYRNGARIVYARALAPGAGQDDFATAFEELIKEDVNILIAPELTTAQANAVLGAAVEAAENAGKDVIGVVGADANTPAQIIGQVQAHGSGRLILVAPGIQAYDAAAREPVDLPGTYSAAAVAGLLSTLSPQTSPTNKVLSGVTRLSRRFSYGQVMQLVNANVMVLEQRQGVRVVRGLTTNNGPFRQVTTRRITDFAKAGIRSVSNQFVGRLNNRRVRAALQGALDGFLTTMVLDEQLIGYTLEVTATRQDEIAGRAMVNAVLQPTFSIDFVAVTLTLQ
jgi:hypothetical protein